MNSHLCSFSGALGDDLAVLRVLASSPRFTDWDVKSMKLARTLDRLMMRGWIKYCEQAQYPWVHAIVTDAGREALATD